MYFGYLCNYLPLEKGRALHLNTLESPSPKDALCQVWLKLVQWIFKILQCIFTISYGNYLPLEKDGPLPSNKLEFPLPKNALFQFWLKLAQ